MHGTVTGCACITVLFSCVVDSCVITCVCVCVSTTPVAYLLRLNVKVVWMHGAGVPAMMLNRPNVVMKRYLPSVSLSLSLYRYMYTYVCVYKYIYIHVGV